MAKGRGGMARRRRHGAKYGIRNAQTPLVPISEKTAGCPERPDYYLCSMTTPEKMTRRILVVDDEALVCESIKHILALDRHEVAVATGGQAALAAFQAGKFDLVIIDYEMPGMRGDKLAAAIKALAPQQPIIMMTAYGEALRFSGEFPLAVDTVMGKPFDPQELRKAVRQTAASR